MKVKEDLCLRGRNRPQGRGTIDRSITCDRFEFEHICWDPKDGDLCLGRMKSGETLMEVRSGTDVQIVRLIWV
jgi:hypothetical protein